MTIRRRFTSFVSILSILLLISACDDEIISPENNLTEKLFGTWDLVKAVKISDNDQTDIPSGFQTLTLNNDHNFRVEMQNLYNSGNWVIVGNNLMMEFTTVQIEGVKKNVEIPFPFDVSDDYLIITSAWDFEGGPASAAYLHYLRR